MLIGASDFFENLIADGRDVRHIILEEFSRKNFETFLRYVKYWTPYYALKVDFELLEYNVKY